MTHLRDFPEQSLHFYASDEYPCSYLDNRQARSLLATPNHLVDTQVYSTLIANGFRRSGLSAYRPHCDGCDACIPVRVLAQHFTPTRSQQRASRHLPALEVRLEAPHFSPDHYQLYLRYQQQRHPGGVMDIDDVGQYKEFLLQSNVNTQFVVFLSPPSATGEQEVKMVTLMDTVSDGLSAVYTFFDPDDRSGLGTLSLLWMMNHAKKLNLPYVYLGYWIQDCKKMAYKSLYQPQQRFKNGVWHPVISHGKM